MWSAHTTLALLPLLSVGACAPASRPDPPAFLSIGQVCIECGGSAEHIVGCADVIALELEYAAESARKIGPILEGEPISSKHHTHVPFECESVRTAGCVLIKSSGRPDPAWADDTEAVGSCRRRRRPRLLEGHGLARAQWWARPGGTTPLGAHVRESGSGERRVRLCAAGGRTVLCVEVAPSPYP